MIQKSSAFVIISLTNLNDILGIAFKDLANPGENTLRILWKYACMQAYKRTYKVITLTSYLSKVYKHTFVSMKVQSKVYFQKVSLWQR